MFKKIVNITFVSFLFRKSGLSVMSPLDRTIFRKTLFALITVAALFVINTVVTIPAILAADTGLQSPTATGEDYNQWVTNINGYPPSNAYTSNNQYAEENRNDQQQDWYNFGFSIPGGSNIDGIEVRVEAQDNYCNDAEGAIVELSWDGGVSYTSTGRVIIFRGGALAI